MIGFAGWPAVMSAAEATGTHDHRSITKDLASSVRPGRKAKKVMTNDLIGCFMDGEGWAGRVQVGGKTQPGVHVPRLSGVHDHWKSRIAALVLVTTASALAGGVAGCAAPANPQQTTGAAPTVVCGTELSDSAASPAVFDATRHLPVIQYTTVGGVLMFVVARGCAKGTHVTWVPASAARLIKAAYAKDGQLAAVVLQPDRPQAAFRLIGTQNGAVVASATVKLASLALIIHAGRSLVLTGRLHQLCLISRAGMGVSLTHCIEDHRSSAADVRIWRCTEFL
jgi:hypothetical protein